MNDRLSQVAGLDSLNFFGNYLFIETAICGVQFFIMSRWWILVFLVSICVSGILIARSSYCGIDSSGC